MGGGRRPFFALVTALVGQHICVRGGIKEKYTILGVSLAELLRSSEFTSEFCCSYCATSVVSLLVKQNQHKPLVKWGVDGGPVSP